MKAQDLKTALKYFGANRLGLEQQDLKFWFVQRPIPGTVGERSARERLKTELLNSPQKEKYLFIGHRGSGKSTELNQLATEIADKFSTIRLSVVQTTGRSHNLEYEDLLLATIIQVHRQSIQNQWLPTPLAHLADGWGQRLKNFWTTRIAGIGLSPNAVSGSISLQLETLLGELEVGLQQSPKTRDDLKEEVNRRTQEFIEILNYIVEEVEKHTKKQLLIIIEDLDKVDQAAATVIFRDYTSLLRAPNAYMIYTFPIALRYSSDYGAITTQFTKYYVLPNFLVNHPKNKPSAAEPSGIAILEKLVLNRLEANLIEPAALRLVIEQSGGVPLWVVRLMQTAINNAIAAGNTLVTNADVLAAVHILRRELRAPLSRTDFQTLKQRRADQFLYSDEDERRVLYNGSLIEYENGDQWCDAHPILWELLENIPND
jgi:hypothetical protein